MKKAYPGIFAALLAVTACTNNEQFRVNGTIEDKPTINLRIGYYADGVYRTQITAAREGEFEFFGSARQPAVVDIYDYEYRLLGRLYARNGQTLDVKLARNNPYNIRIDGDETASEWADFLRSNADSLMAGGTAANNVIARYIDAHRDNILSTLLLTTSFDSAAQPELADSLLAIIEPQARPSGLTDGYNYLLQRVVAETASGPVLPIKYLDRNDSIRTFGPADRKYSVLLMSDGDSWRADSVAPLLRRLARKNRRDIAVLDIGLDPDMAEWKRYTLADSASWTQAWLPGGPVAASIERLAIPRLPYYVVCDSAGTQLCRTPWTAVAERYIDSLK